MNNTYLCHHGIKGQKWGVRRFQNPDGTLTQAGQRRYNKHLELEEQSKLQKDFSENNKKKSYDKLEKDETKISKKYFEIRKRINAGEQVYKNAPDELIDKWVEDAKQSTKMKLGSYAVAALVPSLSTLMMASLMTEADNFSKGKQK